MPRLTTAAAPEGGAIRFNARWGGFAHGEQARLHIAAAVADDLHIHDLPGNGKRNERRASVPKPAHTLEM